MIYCLLAGETIISLDHLESGIAFWNYCFQSAKHIFHGKRANNITQTIFEALQKAGGALAGRELYQLFKNNISKERLEVALAELITSGQVIAEKQQNKKGAPTKLYRFTGNHDDLNELTN
jgi:hypothetical protein